MASIVSRADLLCSLTWMMSFLLYTTSLAKGLYQITKTCQCNKQRLISFKNENFQLKNVDTFFIFAKYIGCGYTLKPHRRGGSNEYPQSLF